MNQSGLKAVDAEAGEGLLIPNKTAFEMMFEIMAAEYPHYSHLWRQSRNAFGEEWERELSLNITRVFGEQRREGWREAADGYAEFCTEALRAQVYFEKHGRYQAENYEQVVKECYHNAAYMRQRYLPGQYLSHYIWPHHQRMLQHYLKSLLPKTGKAVAVFYEVGVGCGLYSQKTLEALPGARGIGFDISDYALAFTAKVLRAHGLERRYALRKQDILRHPVSEPADLIISQEVLEHLEDPQAFLTGLYRAARSPGWGYITAAVNAAHTDHIYLYRSPDEVRLQIEKAGWKIEDIQVECNHPEKPIAKRPSIAGFLTRKD